MITGNDLSGISSNIYDKTPSTILGFLSIVNGIIRFNFLNRGMRTCATSPAPYRTIFSPEITPRYLDSVPLQNAFTDYFIRNFLNCSKERSASL